MKTLAIIQSCYIPWKGYFDLMRQADLFVLYDCVQYTTFDWRNRNRIKDRHGLHWLTIPVKYISRTQRICDTSCIEDVWRELHWKAIQHAYAKAPYFSEVSSHIRALYESCNASMLSDINQHFLDGINTLLNIQTPLVLLKNHIKPDGDKTDKLVAICKHYGATHYLSGPSAKAYLDFLKFEKAGIEIKWMQYSYPEYEQLYPPFVHGVSILDLLFNKGFNTLNYMQNLAETNA